MPIGFLDSLVIIKLLGILVNVGLIFLWVAEMWKLWKGRSRTKRLRKGQ